jgi:hypothetical protein
VSREEDLVRSTTQAIAATVRDVPPLQLEPAADQVQFRSPAPDPGRPRRWRDSQRPASQRPASPRPAAGNRRWRSWAAPVLAAVVVVALAIALVTIKELSSGGVATHPAPTVTGSGGVPRYYTAIRPVSAKAYAPNEVVVGDTFTGKTLAAFPAQAGTAFESVTAAADDRTFVVLDVAHPNPADRGLGQADTWFEVKLAPGSATPVRLVRAPIEPIYEVAATALSASGKELAVATVDPVGGTRGITVYSLANGHVLHGWETKDPTALLPATWIEGVSQWPALTWVDDDRAIAFSTLRLSTGNSAKSGAAESVRAINVAGPRTGGDLMADSHAIWSLQEPSTSNQQLPCQRQLPMVTAGGKTVVCVAAILQPSPETVTQAWILSWITSEETLTAAHGAAAYRVTVGTKTSSSAAANYTLWANSTGSTIIGEWAVNALPDSTSSLSPPGQASIPLVDPLSLESPHFGVISQGKFTPLHLPAAGITMVAPQQIAW